VQTNREKKVLIPAKLVSESPKLNPKIEQVSFRKKKRKNSPV